MSKLVTLIEKAALIRADIAERERDLRESKAALSEIDGQILSIMLRDGVESTKTTLGTVSIKRSTVPQVTDWPAVYDFIAQHQAFDLLQRRLSTTAWRDRADAGDVVPGVREEIIPAIMWRAAK